MNGRLCLFLSVVIFSRVAAQENPDKGWQAISVESVEAPLGFLASDWTEGREVGTKGAYLAADFLASVFQMYGIKLMGDMDLKRLSREYKLKGIESQSYRSYFRNFDLITEIRKDGKELQQLLNARAAGTLAVFRYNPNQKIKSANPSNLPMFSDDEYYESDRKPDDFYLKRIRLPNWEEEEETILVQIDQHLTESILSGRGDLLKNMLQPGYDMTNFKAVNIPFYRFRMQISKDSKIIRARNVLGYIEGTNPNEVVVIGAHYDHVGKYNGFIFNGADDNASGTAGMLTLARAYAESGRKPEKTIVFAALTGQEQGLWGSK